MIMYSCTVVSANTITGTWEIPDAGLEGTFRLERVSPVPTSVAAINIGGVVSNTDTIAVQ